MMGKILSNLFLADFYRHCSIFRSLALKVFIIDMKQAQISLVSVARRRYPRFFKLDLSHLWRETLTYPFLLRPM